HHTTCGAFAPSDGPSSESRTTYIDGTQRLRNQIVDYSEELVGTKYRYGGVNPRSGMDCSGLTNYVFQNAGITLQRSSGEQAKDGSSIKLKDAQPGDLVFFKKGGRVFHVAVITNYDGNNMQVVHSTTSRGVIKEEVLHNSYWGPKVAFVRDVISVN
ncbi:MAG: C40 family peptidase, partial [Bacteroidota bacterium]